MTPKILFFFLWSVMASNALYKDVLKGAPVSYFGFYYMIPLYYHNGIHSSVVKDLRTIFTDILVDLNEASFQRAQERYGRVIDTLVFKCEEISMNSMENVPHSFFKVDKVFCMNLRTKMTNWFYFMCSFLPKPAVFMDTGMDRDGIKNIDIIAEVEPKLGEMANEILYSFELQLLTQPCTFISCLTAMQRALIDLSDISLTFRHNLATAKIVEDFHARFHSLLILYLQSFLPGMYIPVSTTPAVLDRIPFKI